jgi:hypothetical protein
VQLEKQKSNILPAGRYYIGDPAYFLHDAIVEKFFDEGHYALPDGRGLILFKVEADSFITSEKMNYTVCSGLFGLISVDLGDKDKYTGDGTFHTFTSQVSVTFDKDKFNIKAVSMSFGDNNHSKIGHYCSVVESTQQLIKNLLSVGVPAFFPTGNDGDYNMIDWPSCIPESFAIGAGSRSGIDIDSNSDQLLTDFYALGKSKAISPGNVVEKISGTSISTQIAASQWIVLKQAKPDYTVKQITDLINKTSKKINRGKKFPKYFGNFFELEKSLNG